MPTEVTRAAPVDIPTEVTPATPVDPPAKVTPAATLLERLARIPLDEARAAVTSLYSSGPERTTSVAQLGLAGEEADINALIMSLDEGHPQCSWHFYVWQTSYHPKYPHTRSYTHYGEKHMTPPEYFTGIWTQWLRNGQKRFEYGYRNGKLHGPYTTWRKSGAKWLTGSYVKGEKYGKLVERDEKGSIIGVYHHENGKLVRTERP